MELGRPRIAGAAGTDQDADYPQTPYRLGRSVRRRVTTVYPRHMSPMPASGDPCPGFVAQPDQGWRMVYSRQMQATHCRETPSWTGRWFSPRGDRWFHVWACPDHLDRLTGLREFGRRPD